MHGWHKVGETMQLVAVTRDSWTQQCDNVTVLTNSTSKGLKFPPKPDLVCGWKDSGHLNAQSRRAMSAGMPLHLHKMVVTQIRGPSDPPVRSEFSFFIDRLWFRTLRIGLGLLATRALRIHNLCFNFNAQIPFCLGITSQYFQSQLLSALILFNYQLQFMIL